MAEQVLTQPRHNRPAKPAQRQKLAQEKETARPDGVSIVVKRQRTRRRRKSGGWKATKGMRWDDVKLVFEARKAAAEAGTPLNQFVTVKPPIALHDDDTACKRWCCQKVAHVVQGIRGRGKKARQKAVPAVTAYEKRPGSFLHAHALVHVAPGNDALKRLCDGDLVHSHRAVESDAAYLTKQRLPLSPDFEATTAHKRQKSAAIRGARLSMNNDAKALLAAKSKLAPAAAVAAPIAVPAPESPKLTVVASNEVMAEPVQLSFFGEVTRLEHYTGGRMSRAVAEQVKFHQRRLGLKDAALAALIGISRPQLVNARQDKFGLSLQPALRLRDVLLGGGERRAA